MRRTAQNTLASIATAMLVFALASKTVDARQATGVDPRLIGCWRYERGMARDPDSDYVSIVRCYDRRGTVSGATIEGGHGFDWSHRYRVIADVIFTPYRMVQNGHFVDRTIGQRFSLSKDGRRLLTVFNDGKARHWTLLCRTPKQGVQCTRMGR